MVDGGNARVASSVRCVREYLIDKVHPDPGFAYRMYRLSARRSPEHDFSEVCLFDRLNLAREAADRCEWARWEC
jgi:hypothetical protein